jgi:hypothetical protein
VECRRQILNIVEYFLLANELKEYGDNTFWPFIKRVLKDEHGLQSLHHESFVTAFGGRVSAAREVSDYLINLKDLPKSLDVIEFVFAVISRLPEMNPYLRMVSYTPTEAINDLNTRLAQHCLGYRFERDMIIRIDNDVMYQTVTKETLVFLANPDYHNIDEEYRQALKLFRTGDYKDCIVNASKSFESAMKVVCHKMGYPYKQNDTAKPLLDTLYNKQFIPAYLQQHFTALRSLLGEGVSVLRNKTSGHGAGAATIEVDESLASYGLNTAGANIKLLLSLLEKQQPVS